MRSRPHVSRRGFFAKSSLAVAGYALAGPGFAQVPASPPAQPIAGALPDLRIIDVKLVATKRGQLARVLTASGIEGNYPVERHYFHPNWSTGGWLEFARRALIGQNALDRAKIVSVWEPTLRRQGSSAYLGTLDICLWDILGKAVGLPIYRLLGACKEKAVAYASTTHLETVAAFVDLAKQCLAEGFRAIKIHPPHPPLKYTLGIEVCEAVRATVGENFTLLMDPVGEYNRFEALEVGRVLDRLHYYGYEDPLPTSDVEGYAELCRMLDVPIHVGEFIFSIYDYGEYIRRGAVDVLRYIAEYVGGITGAMKVAHLAECFGMFCEPHNWGHTLAQAAHFHCELAMFNNDWFEMTVPQGREDLPYMKDQIRVARDGYVYAPGKPGLGYEIDWNIVDNMTIGVQ